MSRQIDPRGHRFGAGLSVAILAAGFVADVPLVVPAVAVALGASAFFGTQYSVLGRPWPFVRRALRLGPPKELESEFPPRFAQLLGFVGLTLATASFVVGFAPGGWLLAGAVAALQLVLAATGYCLGCRLYGLRWYAPALFDRLIGSTPSTSHDAVRDEHLIEDASVLGQQSGGADEHELAESLGRHRRHFDRQPSTEPAAHDGDRLWRLLAQPITDEQREVTGVAGPVRSFGGAEAR